MDKAKLYRQLVETNKAKLDEGWKEALDFGQGALSAISAVAGFVPVVGQGIAIGLDAANAATSLARGNPEEAALHAASAGANLIPGGGAVAKAGKIAGKLSGAAKTVGNVAKVADKVGDAAKVVGNIDKFAGTAKKIGDVAGTVGDIARKTGGVIDKVQGSRFVRGADRAINAVSAIGKSLSGTQRAQQSSEVADGEPSTSSKQVSPNFLPPSNDAFDLSRKQALMASYNPSHSSLLYERIFLNALTTLDESRSDNKRSGKGTQQSHRVAVDRANTIARGIRKKPDLLDLDATFSKRTPSLPSGTVTGNTTLSIGTSQNVPSIPSQNRQQRRAEQAKPKGEGSGIESLARKISARLGDDEKAVMTSSKETQSGRSGNRSEKVVSAPKTISEPPVPKPPEPPVPKPPEPPVPKPPDPLPPGPPPPKPPVPKKGGGKKVKEVDPNIPRGERVDIDMPLLPTWTGKVSAGSYAKSSHSSRDSRRELPWQINPMTYAPETEFWKYGTVSDSFDPMLTENQQLKSLVSSKVSEYLKSKEGKILKSHLDNLRLDMKNK